MLPKILQSNAPLSADCRARLLKLRASQILELEHIKRAIGVDRASIAENKSAIRSIEQAIKQSKAALVMYNSNIDALKQSKSRLWQFRWEYIEGKTPVGGDIPATCRRAAALIASRVSSELLSVEEQKKGLHSHIMDLKSMLSSLERELRDCNVGLVLSEASLSLHTTFMEGTSSTLQIVKAVLSSIKHVPAEVWEDIFRIAYTGLDGKLTPVPASQVCREWRAISLGVTELWTRIAIHPVPWWPQVAVDRFSKRVTRTDRGHVTFFVYLQSAQDWESQALASERHGSLYIHSDHTYYEDALFRSTLPVFHGLSRNTGQCRRAFKSTYQPDYFGTERRDLIFVPPSIFCHQYSIHFYLGHAGETAEGRPLSVPFGRPDSVTIETPTPQNASLFNILSCLSKVSKLTLLNVAPSAPNEITGILQHLKYLRCWASTIVPFEISQLLASSLEELHLEHRCNNTFSQPADIIVLPKLHTLSITTNESFLCSKLDFPALRTLTLHSSLPARDPISTLDFFKSKTHFGIINHLRFCDWDGMESSPTVIEILKNMMLASPHLMELTYTNCRLRMSDLISIVKSNGSILKVVHLVVCVGITQAECENLRLHIERLTISI